MKKSTFILAIVAVAIVAVAMTVVSCKKDNENVMNSKTETSRAFNPRQIEDMNAYLQDFKFKMLSASKDDESLSLEEAAWHLASLANFEFAKINEDYNNLRFDTLRCNVKVTGDVVLLGDLSVAYESISKEISDFENSITLVNQGIYFINVAITEQGDMPVSIITTFNDGSKFLDDTCYYYEDSWYAMVDCYNYFDGFDELPVQSTGTTELKRVINLIGNDAPMLGYYFTPTTSQTFYFDQNIDPNGSPSLWNSRLYASELYFFYYDLLEEEICYYLDSYLGFGVNARPVNEYIISWNIELKTNYMTNYNKTIQRHELTVNFGEKHPINTEPGGGNSK